MWHYIKAVYKSVNRWISHMDREEMMLGMIVIMIVGFLCMRGFGSRKSY